MKSYKLFLVDLHRHCIYQLIWNRNCEHVSNYNYTIIRAFYDLHVLQVVLLTPFTVRTVCIKFITNSQCMNAIVQL